jgi:hypothetical protein
MGLVFLVGVVAVGFALVRDPQAAFRIGGAGAKGEALEIGVAAADRVGATFESLHVVHGNFDAMLCGKGLVEDFANIVQGEAPGQAG